MDWIEIWLSKIDRQMEFNVKQRRLAACAVLRVLVNNHIRDTTDFNSRIVPPVVFDWIRNEYGLIYHNSVKNRSMKFKDDIQDIALDTIHFTIREMNA